MKRSVVFLGIVAVLCCAVVSAKAQEGWVTEGVQMQQPVRIVGEGVGAYYVEGLQYRYLDMEHGRGILSVTGAPGVGSSAQTYTLQLVVDVMAQVEQVHGLRITSHSMTCRSSSCANMVVSITFQPRATLPTGPTLQHGG